MAQLLSWARIWQHYAAKKDAITACGVATLFTRVTHFWLARLTGKWVECPLTTTPQHKGIIRMKQIKWLMAGALALALSGPAMADDKDDKKPAAKGNRTNIIKELGLTKEQRQKLAGTNKEIREKVGEIRKNNDLDKKAKAAKIREINKTRVEAIKKVLNEEQLKKYEEILAKRKTGGKKNKDK
ncbi:MAG: hypothetical protein CL790_04095 [Chloroflexi bacterium]|nr:hypothetical protein [Chloroflexota bacterium]|tara:strand:- start:502 stop:1053 length:552 start_codon:yes stop_codon:yes gene_type:complete